MITPEDITDEFFIKNKYWKVCIKDNVMMPTEKWRLLFDSTVVDTIKKVTVDNNTTIKSTIITREMLADVINGKKRMRRFNINNNRKLKLLY